MGTKEVFFFFKFGEMIVFWLKGKINCMFKKKNYARGKNLIEGST